MSSSFYILFGGNLMMASAQGIRDDVEMGLKRPASRRANLRRAFPPAYAARQGRYGGQFSPAKAVACGRPRTGNRAGGESECTPFGATLKRRPTGRPLGGGVFRRPYQNFHHGFWGLAIFDDMACTCRATPS